MSTKVSRVVPSRIAPRNHHKSKLVLNIDLNFPLSQNHNEEGTSSCPPGSHEAHTVQRGGPPQMTLIDVDSIDDDVVVSSASAFAEAKNNSRRNRERSIVVDVDSEESARSGANNRNKRRRVDIQPIINCETYVNVTRVNNVTCMMTAVETVVLPPPPPPPAAPQPPPPPPPPKEPAFSCPVCMGPLVEETSTKCGHIFCKACIKASITAQKKCPTCRRKLSTKDIIRVYLPTTS